MTSSRPHSSHVAERTPEPVSPASTDTLPLTTLGARRVSSSLLMALCLHRGCWAHSYRARHCVRQRGEGAGVRRTRAWESADPASGPLTCEGGGGPDSSVLALRCFPGPGCTGNFVVVVFQFCAEAREGEWDGEGENSSNHPARPSQRCLNCTLKKKKKDPEPRCRCSSYDKSLFNQS